MPQGAGTGISLEGVIFLKVIQKEAGLVQGMESWREDSRGQSPRKGPLQARSA